MLFRFDVLLGTARPFVFQVGRGAVFPIDETRFS